MRAIGIRGRDASNRARRIRALLAGTALSALTTLPAAAQNATWLNPATVAGPTLGTFDYDAAANWTPGTPVALTNGPTGTATFGVSTTAALSFSANTTVGAWTFNAGASNYTFTNAHVLTFSGGGISVLGGSASITNSNFVIFNNGTAGNAAIVNNGTVTFNTLSSAGNATITTSGLTEFLGASTGGAAQFNTLSGGTVDISGLSGTFFATGSIEGAGSYTLGSKSLLTTNNVDTVVSGVISGVGGRLNKFGTGTLTLSGVNTYTGVTGVGGGTLIVAAGGSIASAPAVVDTGGTLIVNGTAGDINATGTLSGTGTVAAAQVFGTFAPGSGLAGSTMTVANGIAFQPGATYRIQVSPTAASSANVTGAAGLAGTVSAQFAPGSYVARNYTILTSTAGLGGTTFNALTTTGLPAGFTASLGYTSNNVLLNLNAVLGIATGSTVNRNQQNIATSLNKFFNNGGTLPPGFVSVFGLTGAPLSTALTQLSGETATGGQQTTFNAMSQFMGFMTDPFVNGRGGDAPAAGMASFAEENQGGKSARDAYGMFNKAPLTQTYEPRWSVWAAGFGGSQTTDGNTAAGSNNTTSRIYGTTVGADYRFSPFTIGGFALTGGGTNFSVANGGSGRSDLFQAGAFFKHNIGAAYLSGASAYGWQDVTTDRTVTVAGIDRLRAAFNANAWSGRLESGYRFVTPLFDGIGLTPYAAGQFTTFDLPAYAEKVLSGASTFALAYGSKSVTDSRSELGLRTDKSFAMPNGVFTLRGRAAWAHDFNPDHAVAATFQALPGASFVVNGAAQARNSALTTASAEVKWLNGWSAAATFEGEFSDVTRSYAGKGVVRYSW